MEVQVVDLKRHTQFSAENKIYVALNLFLLGHLDQKFVGNLKFCTLWVDGIAGQAMLRCRGQKLGKVPGSDFLRLLLKSLRGRVIVLGNMPIGVEEIFSENCWTCVQHDPLPDFDLQDSKKIILNQCDFVFDFTTVS